MNTSGGERTSGRGRPCRRSRRTILGGFAGTTSFWRLSTAAWDLARNYFAGMNTFAKVFYILMTGGKIDLAV